MNMLKLPGSINFDSYKKGICLLFLFSCALTGCRDNKAPAIPYAKWQLPAESADIFDNENSWPELKQKTPCSGQVLTLPQLLDIAFNNSPVTASAWQDIIIRKSIKAQARSVLLPDIVIGGAGYREKSVSVTDAGDMNQLRYGPSGKAELLIFDFGGRDAAIEAAYIDMLSSGFMYNQALQNLILEVQESYYELSGAYSMVEAGEANVIDARQSLEAAQMRFEAGIVSKLEQLQAESSCNNALYELEESKGKLEQAKARLSVALGCSADKAYDIAMPDKALSTGVEDSDISLIIDRALSQRPDIAKARLDVMRKQALVRQADSSLYPTVTLGASYANDWYKFYNAKQPRDNDYSYTGYLSFNWDIFDGFYNLNKKIQAEAEFNAMKDELTRLELEASADVWTSYYNYKTALKKLDFARAYLQTAAASHELAFDGYAEGVRSMLDLLQAQSALSQARAKLVESEKGLYTAIARLSHSAGILSADLNENIKE